MAGVQLTLHPTSRCAAFERIDVEIWRPNSRSLVLLYSATGNIDGVLWPAPAAPERTDELWKHTCFEVFISQPGGGYDEFNFSPSWQWAAYRFTGYREGMTPLLASTPRIDLTAHDDLFEMQVTLAIDPPAGAKLALTAVIEETNGDKSYWALAHAPGRPDFHNAAGFAFTLPPMEPL